VAAIECLPVGVHISIQGGLDEDRKGPPDGGTGPLDLNDGSLGGRNQVALMSTAADGCPQVRT
jgi:hypothetical protein